MFNKLFSSWKERERKVLFLRRHWIIPFEIIAGNVLLLFVPLILWFIFGTYTKTFLSLNLGRAIVVISASIYLLLIWLLFYYALIDYWLDVWIVTTKRILHIEQKGLFHRVVAELELSRIQDLTSKVQGVLPTLLGYGTIYIQTAAELPRFIFRQIPDPEAVRTKIMALIKEAKQ